MKPRNQFLSLTLSVSLAAFLSSAIPSTTHSLEVGAEAPALLFSSSAGVSQDSLKDHHILVSFWSAFDAESRVACRRIAEEIKKSDKPVKHIAVNIDSDSALAREIAETDGITDNTILVTSSEISPVVLADYQTPKGCRSFLIDPYGRLEKIIR